jgi:hypothetical protein
MGTNTATPVSRPESRRRFLMALLMIGISLVSAFLLAEVSLRVLFARELAVVTDERNLLYRYDTRLGWFPVAGSSNQFVGTRRITVVNNRQGFRAAADYAPSAKPGIVFLGDSYVWGYDVEVGERFTDKLQARHPDWSIYNFGVSGYGTDQEYLLLRDEFDIYRPKVVFLMYEAGTDGEDNSTNQRWGYYKPYFVETRSGLELRGIPVPRSDRFFFARHRWLCKPLVVRLLVLGWFKWTSPPVVNNQPNPTGPIIRALASYVRSKGATLLVGLTRPDPDVQKVLETLHIPYADLSTELRYGGMGYHWSVEGHTFVADKLERFLTEGKYLPSGANLR